MMFDIRFISRTRGKRPISSGESVGKITLSDSDERFGSDLSYWQPPEYEQQWREAVTCLVNGEEISALITSIADPAAPGGLIWWPMYRIGSDIYVRNAMLFYDKLDGPLDFANVYDFVQERSYSDEDEYPVSEWTVHVDDLESFLSRQKKH